jgi:predicted CXXCH cytochrome family protein
MKPTKVILLTLALVSVAALVIFASPLLASAKEDAQQAGHGDCLSCHSKEMTGKFENGDTVSLMFDEAAHADSVHVKSGLGCRACHEKQTNYPHEGSSTESCNICHWQMAGAAEAPALVFNVPMQDARSLTLSATEACAKCHKQKSLEVADSAHTRIMAQGNRFAPVCVDCHGSHDVTSPNEPRTKIPQICSKCHLSVYTTYEGSVHGAALEADSNADVPTCGDCHGIHKVVGPTENADFRAESINMCGKCHADKALMSKYGISTDVFQTYLDDFHGRTVDFSLKAGATQITKATCYDCHGYHNIRRPDDPASSVYPTNLQKTCQQCHTSANITFPEAWLSHYVPSWEKTPVLYAVQTFYQIFIPTLIGGFLVYIVLDAIRRIFARFDKKSH